jgi:hypothetical protein
MTASPAEMARYENMHMALPLYAHPFAIELLRKRKEVKIMLLLSSYAFYPSSSSPTLPSNDPVQTKKKSTSTYFCLVLITAIFLYLSFRIVCWMAGS